MKRRAILLMVAIGAAVLLASGVALAATTQTFSNTTPIVINDAAAATPYPSPITVSGVTGSVKDVDVILNGFSHTFPKDVDILLEGPSGVILIMSDAGGECAVTDITIKLNDEAKRRPPAFRCLRSHSYKPTNYGDGDTFPPPAVPGPWPTKLNAFDGTDPNGTWNLYVRDDFAEDSGEILRGWSLVIKAG